jgi:hypothetical protein
VDRFCSLLANSAKSSQPVEFEVIRGMLMKILALVSLLSLSLSLSLVQLCHIPTVIDAVIHRFLASLQILGYYLMHKRDGWKIVEDTAVVLCALSFLLMLLLRLFLENSAYS